MTSKAKKSTENKLSSALFAVAEAGLDLCLTCWLSFIGSAARFAVPDKIFGLALFLDFIDRCTALRSLLPPPAALPSLTQRATLVGLITLMAEAKPTAINQGSLH